jgi:hypothetical protein
MLFGWQHMFHSNIYHILYLRYMDADIYLYLKLVNHHNGNGNLQITITGAQNSDEYNDYCN